jgi:hypothetical protein
MSSSHESPASPNEISSQAEGSPKETIPIGPGGAPWIIRYLIHLIILWSVGYVILQPESNYINYITAVLLVLWSAYHLLAMKKKWPPFP